MSLNFSDGFRLVLGWLVGKFVFNVVLEVINRLLYDLWPFYRKTRDNNAIAALSIRVGDAESSIGLKADKVTINSKITSIESELTTIKKLQAKSITTDNISSYIDHSNLTITDQIDAGRLRVRNDGRIDGNFNVSGSLMKKHKEVATEEWVSNQIATAINGITVNWNNIAGKPTAFRPTSHRHSFSGTHYKVDNTHTHTVTINGKAYTCGGVSKNFYHNVTIEGHTGYTGG